MVGDPRDRTAYAIALAGLGLALTVLIAGICWLAVQHGAGTEVLSQGCALHPLAHCRPEASIHHDTDTPYIPGGLWIALAVLGGALVGALIPSRPLPPGVRLSVTRKPRRALAIGAICSMLLVAGAVALPGDARDVLLAIDALAAAVLGLLLGLLIPSPGRGE
jgi:hypothetical protein